MRRKKALVVGVEGLPGCGKTTVIQLLIQALRAMGLRAIAVDIDTNIHASALRAVADALPLDNLVRSMLFWAMRIQQYEVAGGLQNTMDIILMDRTWLGTAFAYDVHGNGVETELLCLIGRNLRPPDITFLFCVPLAVAQARKKSRTLQDLPFARRVARGYQTLARIYQWQVIDATRSPEEVKEDCLGIIHQALAEKACQAQ